VAGFELPIIQPVVQRYTSELSLLLVYRRILCLINNLAIKTHERVEVQVHASLTSARDVGEWCASGSGSFTPGERGAGTSFYVMKQTSCIKC
jgi:hypothetical protein